MTHAIEIVPAPKMDTPSLVAASCTCGYRSGSTTRNSAEKSGQQHLEAKARVTSPELALNRLGPRARDIAKTLVEAGIRGRRQSMGHDPIANYLRRHEYNPVAIFVNETGDGLTINAGVWVDIAAPPAVVEFVRGFDDGDYPGLEEGPRYNRSAWPSFIPGVRVSRCGQGSSHAPHYVDVGPDQPRNCPGTGKWVACPRCHELVLMFTTGEMIMHKVDDRLCAPGW